MKYRAEFYKDNKVVKVQTISGYYASHKPWAFTYFDKIKCFFGYDGFTMVKVED